MKQLGRHSIVWRSTNISGCLSFLVQKNPKIITAAERLSSKLSARNFRRKRSTASLYSHGHETHIPWGHLLNHQNTHANAHTLTHNNMKRHTAAHSLRYSRLPPATGKHTRTPTKTDTHSESWQMEHAPPYSVLIKKDCGLQYQLPSHSGGVRVGVFEAKEEELGRGGLILIRFSGLFGCCLKKTRAHFTALKPEWGGA